jgi:hypothetical protein
MTFSSQAKEMEAVGLRWQETRDFLPYQHFIVFVKPSKPLVHEAPCASFC